MRIETEKGSFTFHCLSAGYFIGSKGWAYPRDKSGSYRLIYMLRGEMTLQEGLSAYQLVPGDLLLLSDDLSRSGMTPSGEKISFYWADFVLSDPDPFGLTVSCKVRPENDRALILFKQLLAMKENYPEEAGDYAAMLLAVETAAVQKSTMVRSPKILREITEWIRRQITTPITAADVGRQFSYNPDYLTYLFKEYFGIGLKEYINEQKIKKAEEYLKTTDSPVKEIAALLGFKNANQFIKYFTYHEGVSPAHYRGQYNQTM